MATSSVNSVVTYNGTASQELRAVNVANDSVSAIDVTDLSETYAQQILNKHENALITVVTLDNPGWSVGSGPAALSVNFGGAGDTSYGNCFCMSLSIDVGIDSVIEYTWTFEQQKAGN